MKKAGLPPFSRWGPLSEEKKDERVVGGADILNRADDGSHGAIHDLHEFSPSSRGGRPRFVREGVFVFYLQPHRPALVVHVGRGDRNIEEKRIVGLAVDKGNRFVLSKPGDEIDLNGRGTSAAVVLIWNHVTQFHALFVAPDKCGPRIVGMPVV